MRLLLFLLLTSLSSSYSNYNDLFSEEEPKIDLYSFEEMVEGYFQYYFEYPKTIESLIDFEEIFILAYPNFWPHPYKDIVINNLLYLKENQDAIKIERKETSIVIQLNESVLLNIAEELHPCSLTYFTDEYSRECFFLSNKFYSPRYFDENGYAIIQTEYLDSVFNKKKNQLQEEYLKQDEFTFPTFSFEKQDIPIYVFFEYSKNNRLSYFCERNNKFDSDLLFFRKLENFLVEFCENSGIGKIIFPIPEYTQPNPK